MQRLIFMARCACICLGFSLLSSVAQTKDERKAIFRARIIESIAFMELDYRRVKCNGTEDQERREGRAETMLLAVLLDPPSTDQEEKAKMKEAEAHLKRLGADKWCELYTAMMHSNHLAYTLGRAKTP